MPIEKIEVISETIKSGIISGMGGVAYYLYQVSKGTQFKMGMFLINIFLAGYVGYLSGGLIEKTFAFRDAIISISGFSAFPILALIEKKFPEAIETYINNKNKKG